MRYRKLTWRDAIIGLASALALALLVVAFASGCVTTSGGKKLDECKALAVAMDGHRVADGASSIVCTLIKDDAKRAECFKYQKLAAKAGGLLLGVAKQLAEQCGIAP